ncbi:MAG: AAA-associated domain-containing protein [Thaumarchaeota archaeon]|nr:AAA-associated domain-containing protein [Nitrososphaerota archaeon]
MELANMQGKMHKSVQNSFMMAYGESTYNESLGKLDAPELEKITDMLSKSSNNEGLLVDRLLNMTEDIRTRRIFESENELYSDVLYSLVASKRKIEQELDWTLCSFDKQVFPLIKKTHVQQIGKITSISNPSHYITVYDKDSSELVNSLNKRIKEYMDDPQWKDSHVLSLLIKNNSKTHDALYLDSKSIPDANDLEKVVLIPKYMESDKITAKKLAEKMKVKPRMAMYYLDAAEMLGVVEREGKSFKATDFVKKLENYSEHDKNEIIRHLVNQLPVVKAFSRYLNSLSITKFTTRDVIRFLEYSTDLSPSTAKRRASTIFTWLNKKEILKHDGSLSFKDNNGITLEQFFNQTEGLVDLASKEPRL